MVTLRDRVHLEELWPPAVTPLEGLVMLDTYFWRDRRVFITGHTGFKGSW